jgi:catechol 2,3-dioxygenase-like lactoylglutathione lyase family enzyme
MSNPTLRWGHININVSDLDGSIDFYRKLGFEVMLPGIPYLGLAMDAPSAMAPDACEALGLDPGTVGRACIMQLGETFPKIDLIALSAPGAREPLSNADHGMVRLCLGSENLAEDCTRLRSEGVVFRSGPGPSNDALADIAICVDPDGTLIELIQPHLERWGPYFDKPWARSDR